MDVYTIEADRRSSTHTGWVFGQYVCDADDRKPRVRGWYVRRNGQMVNYTRLRKDAVAYVERREAAL